MNPAAMTPSHLAKALTAAASSPTDGLCIVPLPFGEARIHATPAALKHVKAEASRWRYGMRVDGTGSNDRFTPSDERPPKEFCLEWGTREAASTAARQLEEVKAALAFVSAAKGTTATHLAAAVDKADSYIKDASHAWHCAGGLAIASGIIQFFTVRAAQAAAMAE